MFYCLDIQTAATVFESLYCIGSRFPPGTSLEVRSYTMSDQHMGRAIRIYLAAVLLLVGGFAGPARAANYSLELVSPRAVGTAPGSGSASITSTNRIYKAYPGIEYNIRAVVVGGAYPYRFALSDAPAGMSIEERTGLIVWTNPQSDASPTITVTDSEGARMSSSWDIAVTPDGFKFVDAVRGNRHPAGTGTISNPWRTISDIMASPAASAGDIVYFQSGTYDVLDLPRESAGSPWERVEISASESPVAWIAYPGASPVLDFGFDPGSESGVLIRFTGSNVYVDGFETRNSRIIGFQLGSGPPSHYRVMRRLRMRDHNAINANLDGTNASFIMTTSSYSDPDAGGGPGTWAQYLAIQDCEFFNAARDMALKSYSQSKMLFEDNVLHHMSYGAEIKADMSRFTYRHNIHYEIERRAIGGNLASATTHGEILFNLVNAPASEFGLDLNQNSETKRVDVYRNTFVSRVRVRNTDGADGPFNFYNNVIVNNDSGTPSGSHIYHENVSDASRITRASNLAGYARDNIVDSSGNLAGSYQQYVGSRGFQISGVTMSPPSPPTDLTVE